MRWVFRTMTLACIHATFARLPYASACHASGAIFTKRPECFRLHLRASIVRRPLQSTREGSNHPPRAIRRRTRGPSVGLLAGHVPRLRGPQRLQDPTDPGAPVTTAPSAPHHGAAPGRLATPQSATLLPGLGLPHPRHHAIRGAGGRQPPGAPPRLPGGLPPRPRALVPLVPVDGSSIGPGNAVGALPLHPAGPVRLMAAGRHHRRVPAPTRAGEERRGPIPPPVVPGGPSRVAHRPGPTPLVSAWRAGPDGGGPPPGHGDWAPPPAVATAHPPPAPLPAPAPPRWLAAPPPPAPAPRR